MIYETIILELLLLKYTDVSILITNVISLYSVWVILTLNWHKKVNLRINKGIKSQDLIGLKCISFLLLLIAPQSQESRTLTLHHSKQYLPILK